MILVIITIIVITITQLTSPQWSFSGLTSNNLQKAVVMNNNNNNSKKINLHIFHAVQITLFSYFHPTSLPTRKYDI